MEDSLGEQTFICDDKFDVVIAVLQRRGWIRSVSYEAIPRNCKLIFRNLSNIKFPAVFDRYVNHFRNSQHLSNKALLAYHLRGSRVQDLQPMTWSAAFEDLSILIGKVLLNSLRCALISPQDEASCGRDTEVLSAIYAALRMDAHWADCCADDCMAIGRALEVLYKAEVASHDPEVLQTIEEVRCSQAWRGDQNIWILKPVGASCGNRVVPVRGLRNLLKLMQDMAFKCVVQKYIEKPLLVRRGRKFDIRQWVLVTDTNPLTIYGFTECYFRLSAVALNFEEANLVDRKMHLCNFAVQGDASTPSISEDGEECHHMMSQREFNAYLMSLGQGYTFVKDVYPKLRDSSVKAIRSVADRIERVGKGFEWLGLDFMLTEELDVLLLEVNVSPDISKSTVITGRMVEAAVEDLFRLIIDEKAIREGPQSGSAWELWHRFPQMKKSDIADFGIEKSKICGLALTMSALDYGPRKLEVAERVMSVLESTELSVDSAPLLSSRGEGNRVTMIPRDAKATQQVLAVEDDPDEI